MASVAWIGNQQNISQIVTITITGVALNGTLSAIINGKAVTYTCTSTDTTTTAATNWLALLNGSTVPPEFTEITWTSSTNVITATASTPGTPFTLTKSQAGGATCTLTTTQANVSQSDVFDAANWLRSGINQLPQNGDDMVIANSAIPLLWNLDQLASVLLNSYTRYQSFTGTIGLPEINPLGYYEYRPTYFLLGSNVNPAISSFSVILGVGIGTGPTRERYNTQSYRTTVTVINAGPPADAYAIRWLGSHGQNAMTVTNTSVGVCMLPTEVTPNGATLNVATVDGGGTLDCGVGCQFSGTAGGGVITITGGTSNLYCTPSVVARNNATVNLAANNGTYASVACVNGVNLALLAPMTISVLTWQKSCIVDNSQNLGVVTLTSATMDGDTCQLLDPNNGISDPNGITVNGQVTAGPFVFTGARNLKVT